MKVQFRIPNLNMNMVILVVAIASCVAGRSNDSYWFKPPLLRPALNMGNRNRSTCLRPANWYNKKQHTKGAFLWLPTFWIVEIPPVMSGQFEIWNYWGCHIFVLLGIKLLEHKNCWATPTKTPVSKNSRQEYEPVFFEDQSSQNYLVCIQKMRFHYFMIL